MNQQEKLQEFMNRRVKVLELNQQLQNELAKDKAELKAYLGICDGEQTSVLDLAGMVNKLIEEAISASEAKYLAALAEVGETHVKALLEVKEELAKAIVQSQKEVEAVVTAEAVKIADEVLPVTEPVVFEEVPK